MNSAKLTPPPVARSHQLPARPAPAEPPSWKASAMMIGSTQQQPERHLGAAPLELADELDPQRAACGRCRRSCGAVRRSSSGQPVVHAAPGGGDARGLPLAAQRADGVRAAPVSGYVPVARQRSVAHAESSPIRSRKTSSSARRAGTSSRRRCRPRRAPRAARSGSSTDQLRAAGAGDLGHRAGRDEPSPVHDDDVRAGLLDLGQQVAGHDDGAAGLRRSCAQHLAHLGDLRRVQAVGRLVEHQHLGQAEHGLGDAEPLLHALAVGRTRRSIDAAEPGDLERGVELGLVGRAGRWPPRTGAGSPGRSGAAGSPGPRRTAPSRDSTGAPGTTGSPNTCTIAGGRQDQPHQHAQRGGLAGAVGPEQADAPGRARRGS